MSDNGTRGPEERGTLIAAGYVLGVLDAVQRRAAERRIGRDPAFAREVASKICFLYDGVVHEEGPPQQLFGNPKQERTRAFLKRIIEAGRL